MAVGGTILGGGGHQSIYARTPLTLATGNPAPGYYRALPWPLTALKPQKVKNPGHVPEHFERKIWNPEEKPKKASWNVPHRDSNRSQQSAFQDTSGRFRASHFSNFWFRIFHLISPSLDLSKNVHNSSLLNAVVLSGSINRL
jgi:hypothetical protein